MGPTTKTKQYYKLNKLQQLLDKKNRELEIEAALEKVRARSLDMRRAEELAETAILLFNQITEFGIKPRSCGFLIMNEANQTMTDWSANLDEIGNASIITGTLTFNQHPIISEVVATWQKGDPYFIGEIHGEELQRYYQDITLKESTSDAIKDQVLAKTASEFTNSFYFGYGMMYVLTPIPISKSEIDILLRFAGVFKLTYRRFLDLQKAEAQARDARVETALEKVRSRSLAMHKAEELGEVATVVFEKLKELDMPVNDGVSIVTHIEGSKDQIEWTESPGHSAALKVYMPYFDHPVLSDYWKAKKKGLDFIAPRYNTGESRSFFNHIFEFTDYRYTPQEIKDYCLTAETYSYSAAFQKNSSIFVNDFSGRSLSEEETDIVKRFSKVFEQAYIRFLDLQKAEAQAREAEIELSLERVRARTMAMHQSNELAEVIELVFEQLVHLDIPVEHAGFIINYKERDDMHIWFASLEVKPSEITIPYFDSPHWNSFIEAKAKGENFFANLLSFEVKNKFYEDLFKWIPQLPEAAQQSIFGKPGLAISTVLLENVGLYIENYLAVPFSEKENAILMRFGKVFQQTYTRFLDLQKSEAQAREAEIQLALERIRARALAMHHSDELQEVVNSVFDQMKSLDLSMNVVSIFVFRPGVKDWEQWVATSETDYFEHFLIRYVDLPVFNDLENARKKGKEFYSVKYSAKKKNEWFTYAFKHTDYRKIPAKRKKYLLQSDFFEISFALSRHIGIQIAKYEGNRFTDQENMILRRFTGVFEQAYTRFLDLQKAEAQAREAEIQLALERVRAKTMSIHESDELLDTVTLLFEQFKKVQSGNELEDIDRSFFLIYNKGNGFDLWITEQGGAKSGRKFLIEANEKTHGKLLSKGYKNKQPVVVVDLIPEKSAPWFDYLRNQGVQVSDELYKVRRINTSVYFSRGYLGITSYRPLSDENLKLLGRFSTVFEQTYTRFLDLQKAEVQAREAQINLALERVRSAAMAMHHSKELSDTIGVLFEQLAELGVNPVNTYLVLYDLDNNQFEFRMTGKGGRRIPYEMTLSFDTLPQFRPARKAWESGESVIEVEYSKEHRQDWLKLFAPMNKRLPREARLYSRDFPDGIFNCAGRHAYGSLGITHKQPANEEVKKLLVRFATEFELVYKRFLDLKKAESQAREAQIEAALERVRASSMAMHQSEDLGKVAITLFNQLEILGLRTIRCGILIFHENKVMDAWAAMPVKNDSQKVFEIIGSIHIKGHPMIHVTYESWEKKKDYFTYHLKGRDLRQYYEVLSKSSFKIPPLDELPSEQINNVFYFQEGALYGFTASEMDNEARNIFKKFARAFGQSYRRFLDLKKAETQAREAEIQLALERVRARTMAMQKSEELTDIVAIVFEKLQELHFGLDGAVILGIPVPGTTDTDFWLADVDKAYPSFFRLPYYDAPSIKDIRDAKESGIVFIEKIYDHEDKNKWFTYAFEHTDLRILPEERKNWILEQEYLTQAFVVTGNFILGIHYHFDKVLSEDEIDIIKRFAGVFDQSYTRFLDLQKAETQAREAEIEAALERVRAQTMAMHNSEDVAKCIVRMFDELTALGVDKSTRFGIGILNHEDENNQLWTVRKDGEKVNMHIGNLDMTLHPLLKSARKAWKEQVPLHQYVLEGEDLINYYKMINDAPDYKLQIAIEKLPVREYHYGFVFKHGFFYAFCPREFQPVLIQITQRFSSVFAQTYQRYLDLRKAEAQAREARIQLALERVRARTMAMQTSDELAEVSFLLNKQVVELGIPTRGCAFNIYNENDSTEWFSNLEGTLPTYTTPREKFFLKYYEAGQRGETLLIEKYSGRKIKDHYKYLSSLTVMAEGDKTADKVNLVIPDFQIDHVAFFKYGYLLFITLAPVPEAHEVFKRFAKEFEQTYTRFLDLQKAEAQAREAQIEAALERVRSRSMGMQRVEDMKGVVKEVYEQLKLLGFTLGVAAINIMDEATGDMDVWMDGLQDGYELPERYYVPCFDHPGHNQHLENWKNGVRFAVIELSGPDKKTYDNYIFFHTDFNKVPEHTRNLMMSHESLINSMAYMKYGAIGWAPSRLNEEQASVIQRFAKVFEQTYTRFLDLQLAETQAREAVKQASLDRVRGQIASMRTKEDLNRITPLIWMELKALEVPFFRCGVFIMDTENEIIQCYLSNPDGKTLGIFDLPFHSELLGELMVDFWQKKKIYREHWTQQQFMKFMERLMSARKLNDPVLFQGAEKPPEKLDLHFIPFKQGMLYVGNDLPLSKDELLLVQSLADAFSIAYARYEDFRQLEKANNRIQQTLDELKSTQTQLIHSEKMASLGELTAGIAHEIQNPLNFVNNFSEVSKELIEELKGERSKVKGERDEVLEEEIINDLIQNLEKINHHGSRASSIVKGMLEHSRSGNREKELTDINILADEYLRLAYHGLRAKDKTFNAEFRTELDPALPKVKVIGQEIGRVLLNLINNAFYAVSSVALAKEGGDYKPQVIVSTKAIPLPGGLSRINSGSARGGFKEIQIIVKDNGRGIPEQILDKIFQPFFTTKPTGEGTGLGLSLSYDIITKGHDGNLEARNREGAGAEFIIRLPVN